MKKTVLLAMLIMAISAFGKDYGEGTVFGALNFNGKGLGYGIGAEYGKNVKKIQKIDLNLGLGLKYNSYDNGDTSEYASKVSTMPIYFNVKGTYLNYYVKGSLGYTIPVKKNESKLDNLKGGAYLGMGIGMNKDNYLVELNYDVSNYSGDYKDSTVSYNSKSRYHKMSLMLGYKFK